MRKIVLIAAMVLVSATAQAGQSRSLITASADQPAASTQPAAVETPKTAQAETPAVPAETPKYVERPAAGDTTTTPPQPKADATKPVPQTTAKVDKAAAKADKPKHKTYWTAARIIGELHRYGIYW
jgi:hypothetical protein